MNTTARRILFAACVGSTAVLAAWLDVPRASQGQVSPDPVICRLEGRNQQITIRSTSRGVRYSVVRGGASVAENLTLEELRVADPVAYRQVESATADTSPAIWAGSD